MACLSPWLKSHTQSRLWQETTLSGVVVEIRRRVDMERPLSIGFLVINLDGLRINRTDR